MVNHKNISIQKESYDDIVVNKGLTEIVLLNVTGTTRMKERGQSTQQT
ncbi:22809_t:CDS:2 [Cetraspora pellucida]|uniref:22809_t:CDS:1 n=1 Tax=Cetraspora pellucida TaxID=1433469 RepID=A0A9N8ZGB7_9GLOM|nr:22809_t:CDS:2 [Cetraspora pellucida]